METNEQKVNPETEKLRERLKEVVDTHEGSFVPDDPNYVEYGEKLRDAFQEVQLNLSSTIGKVMGGDIGLENITTKQLEELKESLDALKKLLP